jgi:hypothetical protein
LAAIEVIIASMHLSFSCDDFTVVPFEWPIDLPASTNPMLKGGGISTGASEALLVPVEFVRSLIIIMVSKVPLLVALPFLKLF